MGKIKKLPMDVAHKIAAGEVIESPYNVIKELVENSIDANSENIIIELKNSGKEEIKVKDDGNGMDKEDLKLSIEKYATSKIRKSEDLYDVNSLGFRGEALSSISEISKIEITTNNGKNCHRLTKKNGKVNIEPSGRNKGTTIIIKDLFYNIPARKKYLNKKSSRLKDITNLITKYSLIYPEISFKLKNNYNLKLNLTNKNLKKRLIKLYGNEIEDKLIKIDTEKKKEEYYFKRNQIDNKLNEYNVKGYISLPNFSKNTNDIIHIFVNNRPVWSRKLNQEIKSAYGRLLDNKNPLIVLFLKTPKDRIDVNVHPKKEEVKFLEEKEVRKVIYHSIRYFLSKEEYFNKIKKSKRKDTNYKINNKNYQKKDHIKKEINNNYESDTESKNKKENSIKKAINKRKESKYKQYQKDKQKNTSSDEKDTKVKENSKNIKLYQSEKTDLLKNKTKKNQFKWRYIGQFNNKYLIFENKNQSNELILIDQHAAEERVNYEKLKEKFNENKIQKQKLISPKTIKLSPSELITYEENQDYFEDLGFEIDLFGKDMIKVRAIPTFYNKNFSYEIINDLINLFETKENVIEDEKERIIQTMACKKSIKSGDELNKEYSYKIIKELFKCKYPYTCPHGRPIIAKITDKELEKTFFRTNKN
ncbi:MAG: DNA mismatch repair endonuclease MutL [Candidatus Woesearchaeota archaeon]